jgi:hypothetical protein
VRVHKRLFISWLASLGGVGGGDVVGRAWLARCARMARAAERAAGASGAVDQRSPVALGGGG